MSPKMTKLLMVPKSLPKRRLLQQKKLSLSRVKMVMPIWLV